MTDEMKSWREYDEKKIPSIISLEDWFYETVPKDSNVIDFGCAWGRNSFKMQEAGLNVTGIDLNKKAIEQANALARKTNTQYSTQARFYEADATHLPQFKDQEFDAAVMIAFMVTQVNPTHRMKVLSEARRILKPNGVLYIADFGDNSQNPRYTERYAKHFPITREWRTFLVTDTHGVDGRELYRCHHYTKEELSDLIKPGFEIARIDDKVYHTGTSNANCLVILANRK